MNPPSVKINESIISLLLKLHSHLSGIPDSYNPEEEEEENSTTEDAPIGDGPYFIERLLKKMSAADGTIKTSIEVSHIYFNEADNLAEMFSWNTVTPRGL